MRSLLQPAVREVLCRMRAPFQVLLPKDKALPQVPAFAWCQCIHM